MFRKILYIYPEILGFCKLLLYKLIFGNGLILRGIPRFSCKSDIRIRKNCRLELDDKCHITDHVTLRVAAHGDLVIKSSSSIGQQTIIVCHDNIQIGNNVMIGPNVTIYDHDHDFRAQGLMNHNGYVTSPIIIEDNVWIGSNVVVLKGVRIGEGSVIASGTLVNKDVPSHTILYNKRVIEMTKLER